MLGVRPTSGGFQTAEIVPDLGDLVWAEGDISTPGGLIHVRAERQGSGLKVRLRLPAHVDAVVALPGRMVLRDGRPVAAVRHDATRTFIRLSGPGSSALSAR